MSTIDTNLSSIARRERKNGNYELADIIDGLEIAIANQRAENVWLRAALKPFADYADPSAVFPPNIPITNGSRLARRQLTMGDCYEAARVLEQKGRAED